MRILKASEDYLETMLMLKNAKGIIRSVDIAEMLGVTKPSVSYATKRLRENGYITMDKDGLITLTELGLSIAENMYSRHQVLTEFLIKLGVDEKTALEDACKIEHDISEETFSAIQKYMEKYAGKIPLLHMKDYARPDGKLTFVPCGSGLLDIPAVLDAAEKYGVEDIIVEQDGGCLADIKKSIEYLFEGSAEIVEIIK